MLLRVALLLAVSVAPSLAASIDDATGRHVVVSDHITRVLPAGEPATALMVILAPDLMIGWPHRPNAERMLFLPPALAKLPEVPRIDDTAGVKALKPDLILDYGDVDAHYTQAIISAQAATGVPSVLISGAINETPKVLRTLGAILHREARAEMLAEIAERMLPVRSVAGGRTAMVIRGQDLNQVLVAGGNNSELFDKLGFRLLAPEGSGRTFRPATVADVARLDPDVIFFLDPRVRTTVQSSAEWRGLRAMREGQAWIVPTAPFGWLEGPAAPNRLIGLEWLAENGLPRADFLDKACDLTLVLYGEPLHAAHREPLSKALAPLDR